MSLASGALVASLISFFMPAVLLGTLSPYAVRLEAERSKKSGVGSVSGKIFFWSTMGSISGSLLTGFVLIPGFGVNAIMITVGLVLTGYGTLILLLMGVKSRFLVLLIACSLLVGLTNLDSNSSAASTIYSKDGLYEKITIYDRTVNGRSVRFFQQDKSSSGATFLDTTDPTDLVYDYTKYYDLYKLFTPNPTSTLVIGGGAYSIPKALLADLPEASVIVSEIEPSLFELSKKYFGVTDNPRLTNTTQDGRQWLRTTNERYDIIFSDVYYSYFSIPAHFTTKEFFELAYNRMNDSGIFIANMIGDLSRQEPSLIMSEIKTFQTAFPNSYFFAVEGPNQMTTQNIMFVGYKSDKIVDTRAQELLNHPSEIIRSLPAKTILTDRFDLSSHLLLTDDYAPVDSLTNQLITRQNANSQDSSGNEMLALINQQLSGGPRHQGAKGYDKTQALIRSELDQLGGIIKNQRWIPEGQSIPYTNIIGSFQPELTKRIILGTHYDTKRFADKDAANPTAAVPGANDGASGTAVLLELARRLKATSSPTKVGVDFVFFDGEEGDQNLTTGSTDWKPLGSSYFAHNLTNYYQIKPELAIIVDMVCDQDLQIFKEPLSIRSTPTQVDRLWNIGRTRAPQSFLEEKGRGIMDDHTPLIAAGIPSMLVIDIDYPYFHTTQDTTDKCSTNSLQIVADTLYEYIMSL